MSPALVRSSLVGHRLGQAEVGDPDGPLDVQQQVRRLDVAVQDPLAVGVVQGLGHLEADPRDLLGEVPARLPTGSSSRRGRPRRAARRLGGGLAVIGLGVGGRRRPESPRTGR